MYGESLQPLLIVFTYWHCVWQVIGTDEDNARVMVSLAVGSSTTTVSQYAIKLVTKSEFDKFSKYISKLTTYFFQMLSITCTYFWPKHFRLHKTFNISTFC